MKIKKRMTLTVTLDEYETQLFETALAAFRGNPRYPQPLRSAKRMFILAAITAFSSAVIKRGNVPWPVAVDLRHENREETDERVDRKMPLKNLNSVGGRDRNRSASSGIGLNAKLLEIFNSDNKAEQKKAAATFAAALTSAVDADVLKEILMTLLHSPIDVIADVARRDFVFQVEGAIPPAYLVSKICYNCIRGGN